MAEGTKVVGEAISADAPIEAVYVDPAAVDDAAVALVGRCANAGHRVYDLAPGVLERVAGTVHPQPVLAIVRNVDITLDTLGRQRPDLVVVGAEMRDPGNAGTLLRAAAAAGAGAVICCDGSVDVYNPKTVRASAGAVFHLPVVVGGEVTAVLDELSRWGLTRLGAAARGGRDHTAIDLCRPVALVVGNEANGLATGVEERIDEWLTIPMAGRSESLNVGIAAAVVCFEAARQRRRVVAPAGGRP